ncbi:MAG: hypothetical protein KAT28_03525 [Candidatus Aenigmarchaeota archaeon]|nr:hypothetical protein [Candidatus Aenigmarchaeota archaeon]
MNLLEKYQAYREIGMKLNHKILDSCVNTEILMKSAKLLGIPRKNDIMLYETEDEMGVLMEFTMHEQMKNNKNAIEIYRDKYREQNRIEKTILDAMLLSYTSLFRVISSLESENIVLLYDVLNKKDNIKLIDINLSKTVTPGLLFFTRIVPFKDFNMTSGFSFVFQSYMEEYLRRRYKKIGKKVESDRDSIKRFVSFFRLNKEDGMEVDYEDVS